MANAFISLLQTYTYTWDSVQKKFNRRKQGDPVEGFPGVRSSDVLGRVYTVHPNNAECFFLRMLLHTVTGPKSFEDLRTVDGQGCASFREACQLSGLLEDDRHLDHTLAEAATVHSASRLRNLFAITITTCFPSDPSRLWESFKESLSEDLLLAARRRDPSIEVSFTEDIFNEALILLENKCLGINGKRLKELGLPEPKRSLDRIPREILAQTNFDFDELQAYVDENEPKLTEEQRLIYEYCLNKEGGITNIDAPGGTGKTFLIKLLLAKLRLMRKITIPAASSGSAATIIGGGTAHSTFKLPLNLANIDNPTCNISKGSGLGKLLALCHSIFWDECTMAHKGGLEALDRSFRDLKGNSCIMGGTSLFIIGDFRQTLPVVPRGTPADELNACLKSSYLWPKVTTLRMKTNMRVLLTGDADAAQFQSQLLSLGDGHFPTDANGLISFPPNFCNMVSSLEQLKNAVFPNIQQHFKDLDWLSERAILAPKNDCVNSINFDIVSLLPGESKLYKSVDTVTDPDQAVQYPTEFLNSLEPSGMPSHKLLLKVGAPIILLRNLDTPKLCNGTRLCVKKLFPNVIEATILTGFGKGEDVFIPRIPLIPNDFPFEFKRLQFPVRLSFAMTINKSQGQTMKVVGVNLETPCFSHGQLYVACSRVGSPKNLHIFAPESKTRNIVYQQALK